MKKVFILLIIFATAALSADMSSVFIRKYAEKTAQKISSKIDSQKTIALDITDNTANSLFTSMLTENLINTEHINVSDIHNRKALFREAVRQHNRVHDENKNEIRFSNPKLMVIGSVDYSIQSKLFKKKHQLKLNLNIDEIHTDITIQKINETYSEKEALSVLLLVIIIIIFTVLLIIINSMTKGYFSKLLFMIYILFVIAVIIWYFLI